MRHTGLQVNATSKRVEFLGTVMNTVKALSDMPHGGQIIMDEKSFEGVKLSLADLYDMVPHGPSLELLQQQCRCVLPVQPIVFCMHTMQLCFCTTEEAEKTFESLS